MNLNFWPVVYAKWIKLNNKIIESWNLSKLVEFLFYNKSYFYQWNFPKNASLLQKLKNKILSCGFPMKAIPSVFGEVEIALYGSENV